MDIYRTEALLLLDEGERLKVYPDTEGNPTIGVGRNVGAGGPGLRPCESRFMLSNDVHEHIAKLSAAFPVFLGLSDVRCSVLISMCHNMGFHRLSEFTRMWEALGRFDYRTAAAEMVDSDWYRKQPKKNGHPIRGDRLVDMMISGQWPAELPAT